MKRLAAVAMFGVLVATGCRFERHQGANNGTDKVNVATPFGGMSVKTDEKKVQAGVGLSVYPGAVLNRADDKGRDSGAADVNFSLGDFHVGVRALNYQTGDSQDKVLAFYRKDMARYGAVVLCHDHEAVGQPARTQDGLSCDSDGKTTGVKVSSDGGEDELKAGSKYHQHIVSVEPKNGGTQIGLVALDLPSGMGGDDSKE